MVGLTTGSLTVNLKYRINHRSNAFTKGGDDWTLDVCLTKPERWFTAYIYETKPEEATVIRDVKLIFRSIHIYRDAIALPSPRKAVRV